MSASLYQPFYLILVTILSFFAMKNYAKWGRLQFYYKDYSYKAFALFICIFLTLFIGFRPVNASFFVDMAGYEFIYYLEYYGAPFYFDWDTNNFIWDNLEAWMGSQMIDVDYFFLLIAFIYFFCMLWGCMKLFPKDSFLAFVVYLGAFSTFSYGTNGIKAGAAASLFLVALGFYSKDNMINKCIAGLFLWLSLGFHHAMIAPIVAFVIAHFYKNPKIYLYGWCFCLLMAALHITFFMTFFTSYTDEHGAEYLQDQERNNVSGFRPDFYFYSAIPIVVGYYLIVKEKINSNLYQFLWCVYTLTNGVFLLCTYGSFINRIAYLSWLMFPFVLLYPFVNIFWSNLQNQYLKYVVYGHLAFTLFMFFIYY